MADDPQRLEMRLAWVGLEDVPIVVANQAIGQLDDHAEAIITFGQASPPVLIGTPEEQRQQAANVPFVQIRPIARIGLTTRRIEELMRVLEQTLENQKRMRGQLEETN